MDKIKPVSFQNVFLEFISSFFSLNQEQFKGEAPRKKRNASIEQKNAKKGIILHLKDLIFNLFSKEVIWILIKIYFHLKHNIGLICLSPVFLLRWGSIHGVRVPAHLDCPSQLVS